MAISLVDVASSQQTELKVGIVKNLIETSPLLNFFPIETLKTLFYRFIKEGKLPQANTRNLGSPFPTQDEAKFEPGNLILKVLGGEFAIDRNLEDEKNADEETQIQGHTRRWSRAISLDWKRLLVKGDSSTTSTDPDGLEALGTSLSGQTIDFAGAVSGINISAASVDLVVQSIDELIDKNTGAGLPDLIITNRDVLRALRAKALSAAANNPLAEIFKYTTFEMKGVGDKPMKVRAGIWDGNTPMIPADGDSQGVAILPQSEAAGDGSGSSFSSMYSVVTGEDFVMSLQKFADGPQLSRTPEKTGSSFQMEWPIGLVNHHKNAIAIMRGIGVA